MRDNKKKFFFVFRQQTNEEKQRKRHKRRNKSVERHVTAKRSHCIRKQSRRLRRSVEFFEQTTKISCCFSGIVQVCLERFGMRNDFYSFQARFSARLCKIDRQQRNQQYEQCQLTGYSLLTFKIFESKSIKI